MQMHGNPMDTVYAALGTVAPAAAIASPEAAIGGGVLDALTGGGGGGGGGAASPYGASQPISVAPSFQTAISPMISPTFVQTGAGSTGSVSASTVMSAGTTQKTSSSTPGQVPGQSRGAGSPPYGDVGYPYSGNPPEIAPVPANVVQTGGLMQYLPYAFGALALVALVSVMKGRKTAGA